MKKYFKLDLPSLPDDLHNKETDVKKWLSFSSSTSNNCDKFQPNSLNQVLPIEKDVELERLVGISLHMIGNAFPFAFPLLLIASFFSNVCFVILKTGSLYLVLLYSLERYYFLPYFAKKHNRPNELGNSNDIRDNQYAYTERNNQKYTSLKFVWPEAIHRPSLEKEPVIFCAIPHGVAPLGITAYPVWSKLFNDKLCRWTTAPVVLSIPVISKIMKYVGYIPAKSKNILDTLTKKEENVGIILDGIAGMFQSHDEIGHIVQRKGIVKIALRAGVKIIPVYCFGHTSLWNVVVDPFGFLEWVSVKLDVSIIPFFGRYFWFLGPPHRVAVCMCLGEPITCPKIDEPTKQDVDKYHSLLLKGYEDVFEHHKEAYGWGDKKLKFV